MKNKMKLYVFLMIINAGTLMCLALSHGNFLLRISMIAILAFALGKLIKAAVKILPQFRKEQNNIVILTRGLKKLNH